MNIQMWGAIIGGALFFLMIAGFLIYLYLKKPKGSYQVGTISKNGGENMDKLEDEVFKEFEGAYNDMMAEIKRAEQAQDGIDLKDIIKSQATRFTRLNSHFRDAKVRMSGRR